MTLRALLQKCRPKGLYYTTFLATFFYQEIYAEHELEAKSNLHFLQIAHSEKPIKVFSLDVIISVGYQPETSRLSNSCYQSGFS